MRKPITLILLVAALLLGIVQSASADSVGQCNNTPGNTVTSNSDWQHMLAKEGVIDDLKSAKPVQGAPSPFRKAGWVPGDQSLSQWMSQRVIAGSLAKATNLQDYGCRDGKLFNADKRHYGKGKHVRAVVPSKYAKSDLHVKKPKKAPNGKKGKWVHQRIRVLVIGLDDCGNPVYGWGYIYFWVFVEDTAAPKTTPTPKPADTPTTPSTSTTPTTPSTPGGGCTITVNGTSNAPIACGDVNQKCVINGSSVSDSALCTSYGDCVAVQGNTWDSKQNVCVTPPPKQPTCADIGQEGTYPNCHPHHTPTCADTGQTGTYPNCTTPHCPSGQTGTYPDCHTPSCPSGQTGTYPNCHTPTCQELGNCPTPKPSASAALDCKSGGNVIVTLGNTGNATATFSVNGTTYTVAAGSSKQATVLVAEDSDVLVTVTSGGATLINQTYHRDCETPPVQTCQNTPSKCPAPEVTGPQVNDVEVSQTRPYCVDYNVPSGYTAKLTYSAHLGTFSNTSAGNVTVTVSGSGEHCETYTAPGEVPSSGTDTITLKIVDDHSGMSDTFTSDPFTIKPKAVHPA